MSRGDDRTVRVWRGECTRFSGFYEYYLLTSVCQKVGKVEMTDLPALQALTLAREVPTPSFVFSHVETYYTAPLTESDLYYLRLKSRLSKDGS